MREDIDSDCRQLMASEATTFARDHEAPNPDWGNGYEVGQALACHIELSRRLENCYVDMPDTHVYVDR
jgi:hypothetical protein